MATKALDMVVAPVAATVADMAAGDLVDLVSHRHKQAADTALAANHSLARSRMELNIQPNKKSTAIITARAVGTVWKNGAKAGSITK